ncbi:MAG: ABC transporter ATP-binding protein [Pseudomonadota bacterium]
MPHLELNTVAQSFPAAGQVLGPVNLSVETGERISVVGPSGCGKSTLLRIIAGLDKAHAGSVRVNDPAEPHRQVKGGIGFVFQDAALLPWASVFDNVWLPLRLRGASRIQAQESVHQALASVSLQDWADARPDQLSGGMRMRVSIARALIEQPSLLLMDEPFAALDELTRFELNDMLSDLVSRESMTLVFVTHSVIEAAFLSSRVLILSPRPGRIVDDIACDFPFPRHPDLRSDAEFLRCCASISAALRQAAKAESEPA